MNRIIFAATGVLLLAGLTLMPGVAEADDRETVFGPVEYLRTKGDPDLLTGTFDGMPGREAFVHVRNGNVLGEYMGSVARVLINGVQVFGPQDFKPKVAFLSAEFRLQETNTISVELDGAPGSLLMVEVTASYFYEETPAWRRPDLAVTGLAIEPDRADPGTPALLRATVASVETATAGPAQIQFLVAGVEVCASIVEPLDRRTATAVECSWTADEPGRHEVVARLIIDDEVMDFRTDNNQAAGIVRISGEENPLPEMVLRPEFDPMDIVPGESFEFKLTARNPSFAEVTSIPLSFLIDGEMIFTDPIESLYPAEERTLSYTWANAEAGRHIVTFRPEASDDPNFQPFQYPVLSVDCIVMYQPKQLYWTMQKDKWVSIGPGKISGGSDLPNGSVGRVDAVAFDPFNPDVMYAAPYRGGLWKTGNGGVWWDPLTDGLPTLYRGAVAVDPKLPGTIYYGTGYYMGGEAGHGIFKSTDGGTLWSQFASENDLPPYDPKVPVNVVEKLVIRDTPVGRVIYAATNRGLLRYTGTDPGDLVSDPWEWIRIMTGEIWDLAVNPNNPSEVYVSLLDGGLWRTYQGETTTSTNDWTEILPRPPGAKGHFEFDVFWDQPKTIWAALDRPGFNYDDKLLIFKYRDPKDGWKARYHFNPEGLNEFIRVHPTDPDEIYFGAVNLYWCQQDCGDGWKIHGVHADQKDFQWDPTDSDVFWSTNDGGVFRCEWDPDLRFGFGPKGQYRCEPRNYNMRISQFWDFDSSLSNPSMMTGGTQDNGTILYTGNADEWKNIKGGDGYYSQIAKGNDRLFAQHQRLDDTDACEDGTSCSVGDWNEAFTGLPGGDWHGYNSQIAKDPLDGRIIYSIGPEVHMAIGPGFWNNWVWYPIGPTVVDGLRPDDEIRRLAIHPQRVLFAGTQKGEIWAKSESVDWKKVFSIQHWNPNWNANSDYVVNSMDLSVADPSHMYVVFGGVPNGLRIFHLRFDSNLNAIWASPIISNFPLNDRQVRVIAGDGHKVDAAYVGTDLGVFKGESTCAGCVWTWKDYSDGLPMVQINDLLVDPTSKELRAGSFGRGAWSVITGP